MAAMTHTEIRKRGTFRAALARDKFLLLMFLPGILYYAIFHYGPMYGLVIAFQNFSPWKGIMGSPFVGFEHFVSFFGSPDFGRLLINTFLLNAYSIIFGFPVPIIFALLLSEVRDGLYKRIVQSTSYLPHFVSSVVVVGIFVNFLNPSSGIVNRLLQSVFGLTPINFPGESEWFRTLYTTLTIWARFGWTAIIYIAAITGISPTLYEAAVMDGAGRWQRMRYVTLPGIVPTIVIMFLLQIGQIVKVGFETVYLLQNPANMGTGDVFATFVYRRGIMAMDWSFAAAVGFFESLVGLCFVVISNKLARRLGETSLW
ncbi:MAG: ABC transporter permease [Bacteroidota bacterium]